MTHSEITLIGHCLDVLSSKNLSGDLETKTLSKLDALSLKLSFDWTEQKDLKPALRDPTVIGHYSDQQCVAVLISLLRKSRYVEGLIEDARGQGLIKQLADRWRLLHGDDGSNPALISVQSPQPAKESK